MRVLKFGGTSVGNAARMKEVMDIITADEVSKVVVLSAVSGTTNRLVALGQHREDPVFISSWMADFQSDYRHLIDQLYLVESTKADANAYLDEKLEFLRQCTQRPSSTKEILAQGELISTQLFTWLLADHGVTAVLLPALNFMRIDKTGEPDEFYIRSMLEKELQIIEKASIYITQGYICRNAFGEVDNLKRGGSDYTATLLGQALDAEEIQIWTDIDGMHNNDPRIVDDTYPVRQLSYDEAAELAYFGAKILHPSCVLPAQKGNIPIRLKNTMDPNAPGTLISHQDNPGDVTAIAAKDGITAIKIKSGRMLMAYGFLKQVFEVFEKYQTPIDMITTSEVAVSLTIDDQTYLTQIIEALQPFGAVEVDQDQTILCIVGHFSYRSSGYASTIFEALKEVPIRMISYGGSKYNVSVLVDSSLKSQALRALNKGLFRQ